MNRQILKIITVSGFVGLSIGPALAQQAGLESGSACFQLPLGGSIGSFVSGKRPCLGGRAPLVEVEKIGVLDQFNQPFARKDLLMERPLQGRMGLLIKVGKHTDMGAAYRYTTTKKVRSQWFNHMMPLYRELPGHVAVLRLRMTWY